MAERPARPSAIEAARGADWVPKPRKDIGYPLDTPVRGSEESVDQRYLPPRYAARLRHALDGVITLWGECYFCGRVARIEFERIPARFQPLALIRDMEKWLRCTGCGARAREGANLDLLSRPSWETAIVEREGRPVVWIPREPKPKLVGKKPRR